MTKKLKLEPTRHLVMQGSGIGKVIDTPEEQAALDSALERAQERGRIFMRKFATLPPEEQADIIAGDIYHYVRGGEMGCFGFDELPEKPTKWEDDKSMCQEAYRDAARWIVRLFRYKQDES